ncbi:zinc carboxypeptidase, partial [Ostertagia ostertagi]
TTISKCLSLLPVNVYYSNDVIGESLGGNAVNLLTVTAKCSAAEISKKHIVFLSSRVHPGESNASWMMHGILEALLTSSDPLIEELRARFVFKLVPMLNPDGVVNGSHRCSLSGVDLNRYWLCRSSDLGCDVLKTPPSVFVDLHGHSRRANVFMFGNNPEESWRADDKALPHNYEFMALPEVLEQNSSAFSFDLCQFGITRGKESSARVTVWRQFGVTRAYTMESTFSGFETGAYKGFQIGTKDLKDVGRELLLGILSVFKMGSPPKKPSRSGLKKRGNSMENASVSVGKS